MRSILLASAMLPIGFASAPAPAANATKAKGERVEPQLTTAIAIDLPARQSRRGSETKYPFDSLTAVGMAFGVKNKTAKNLNSIVSNANRKNQVNETDSAGNVVYKTKEISNPDGTKAVLPTNEPKKIAGKHFVAIDVDAEVKAKIKGTALEGSTVLVQRDK